MEQFSIHLIFYNCFLFIRKIYKKNFKKIKILNYELLKKNKVPLGAQLKH